MWAKAKLTFENADVAPKQIHRLQMESAVFLSNSTPVANGAGVAVPTAMTFT